MYQQQGGYQPPGYSGAPGGFQPPAPGGFGGAAPGGAPFGGHAPAPYHGQQPKQQQDDRYGGKGKSDPLLAVTRCASVRPRPPAARPHI